ncbi:hypothetical protein ACXHWJ_08555 [Alcaligenes nematophilus]
MNLGAAIMQIAEHKSFTAINPLKIKKEVINNAFLINDDTCLFLKYGQEPKRTGEYQFTFSAEQLKNIRAANKGLHLKVFLALICVEDQEICCLSFDEFESMIQARTESAKQEEESYQVLVTVPNGKSLRAYTNAAGVRKKMAHDAKVISRNRYPSCLFGQ